MTVAVIIPEDSILSGIERKYLVSGLLIIAMIGLAHYSKFVVFLAVSILAIGANLPDETARVLSVDPRILMGTLVAMLLVLVANRVVRLPTGLDKPQGFPDKRNSVVRNLEITEPDLTEI